MRGRRGTGRVTKATRTVAARGAFRQRWLARGPADRLGRWALLSGLLAFLAFPPVGAWPLIFVAFVPLVLALRSAAPRGFGRLFRLGWLGAFAYFTLLLHWILFLANDEVTIPGIMLPALFVLAAYLALYFGLALGLAGWLGQRGPIPLEVWFALLWTLADRVRDLGETAFPWGTLGYALARHPSAIQGAAYGGVYALTLWIAAVNAAFAIGVRGFCGARRAQGGIAVGAGLLLLLLPLAWGSAVVGAIPPSIRLVTAGTGAADGAAHLRATLLQANTSREIKWKPGYRKLVVDDLNEKTAEAARDFEPDLIIWPETAAPVRIPWEKEIGASVRETIASIGRPVLVGTLDAVITGPNSYEDFNAAILFGPEGEIEQRYYKAHLVPFGEVTPWKRYVPLLTKLDFGQSEFTPGREATIFEGPGGARFRVLICFESIFGEISRQGVRDGARYLVNITNDFWFGRSAGPVQHADMAILRAVEDRTPLLRCANSGLSFFVDPAGRVVGETELFTFALPTAEVAPGLGGSSFTRHGEAWMRALALLAALLAGVALLPKRHLGS